MIGTIMRSLKYIMDISKVVVLDWTDTTSGQSLSDTLIKQNNLIEFKGGLQLAFASERAGSIVANDNECVLAWSCLPFVADALCPYIAWRPSSGKS